MYSKYSLINEILFEQYGKSCDEVEKQPAAPNDYPFQTVSSSANIPSYKASLYYYADDKCTEREKVEGFNLYFNDGCDGESTRIVCGEDKFYYYYYNEEDKNCEGEIIDHIEIPYNECSTDQGGAVSLKFIKNNICDSTCETCDNEGKCTSCKDSNKVKTADERKCVACDSTCECDRDNHCVSCKNSNQIKIADESKCVSCDSTCECDRDNHCISCKDSTKVKTADESKCVTCNVKDCKICSDNDICSECNNNLLVSSDKKKCIKCNIDNCEACSDNDMCSKCNEGYDLSVDNKQCNKNNDNKGNMITILLIILVITVII